MTTPEPVRSSIALLPTTPKVLYLVLPLMMSFCLGTMAVQAQPVTLQDKLQILGQTYPSVIEGFHNGEMVLKSGARIVIDDGIRKNHQNKLVDADIEDMLSQIYPIGACSTAKPERSFDPGRIRNGKFMQALFGQTKPQARSSLRSINWFGSRVSVTRRHGVDLALEKVRDDLDKLPRKFRKFFVKSGGTFNWRFIAGTKRLSVHSFGAAIDINTKFTDYWRWSGGKPGNVPKYKNKIPMEIVSVFERHGFIWGGKWYHYDTMHFEYRPELIAIGKLAESRGCASG